MRVDMKSNYWSTIWKSLVAFAAFALLWGVFPVIASILGTATGLCIIAHWDHSPRFAFATTDSSLDDFERRVSLAESRRANIAVANNNHHRRRQLDRRTEEIILEVA